MQCSQCGAELRDGVRFCSKCGASAPASPIPAPPAPAPDAGAGEGEGVAKKSPLPIVVIVASIVIIAVCVAAVLVVFGGNKTSSSNAGSQQGATASASASSATAAGQSSASVQGSGASVAAYSLFRVSLPKDVADKVTYSTTDASANTVTLKVGDVPVLTIETTGPKGSHDINEAKIDSYSLGEAQAGSDRIGLRGLFYYKSSKGDGATHWGDSAANELLCAKLLGMTPDQLLDCIELNDKGVWVKAQHAKAGSDSGSSNGAAPAATANANDPFWGIWIGASKDEGEANAIADEASSKGLDASVTVTTDWENLNSEPWYVITAGRFASESEADSKLGEVQSAGYGDAYVKYSGGHR